MTKKDIVRDIASKLGVSQNLVHEVVQRAFESITETLLREQRVELRNFGVFELRVRAPRKARNPRTNKRVEVPRRVGVRFKPGKEMAKKISSLSPAEVMKALGAHLSRPATEIRGVPPSAESQRPARPDAEAR